MVPLSNAEVILKSGPHSNFTTKGREGLQTFY